MKLQDLNTQQLKAVQTVNKPVLVFAGAGSGKTRVLTYKVWHLIKENLFKPNEILALTFTNKAASEMKERIKDSINCDGVNVGTFHSIGARILRMHINYLHEKYNSDFTIYDVADQKALLKEVVEQLNIEEFKELNIILKGDVDGSVEALTDSLQKLSTEEIQVNIIHKAVGAITESDVLLASASDAIVVGFNVRPMGNARQIADKEQIDIRTYSIIYDAINDVKDAMEGMLSPDFKEEITGLCEVRETFKISKIGTIAGCMVTKGKIVRNSEIRLIREGVVIYTGSLSSLKRFKDDTKEVTKGYDCGLQIKDYKDIKVGDEIEGYINVAIKKKI